MKIGVIGLGRQGNLHARALKRVAEKKAIHFCGVCDLEESVLQHTASYLDVSAHLDYKVFIASEQPDLVILALPNDEYSATVNYCLANRVNVIKEKPFALTMEETDKYINFSEEKDVDICITQQRFFSGHYICAKRWLDHKRVGVPISFEYRYAINDLTNSWYWDEESGGGCWLNMGWHIAFVLSWFFGEPEEFNVRLITSNRRPWRYTVDDTAILECKYKDGMIGTAYVSSVEIHKEESLVIRGTEGTIRVTKTHSMLRNTQGDLIKMVNGNSEMDIYSSQLETIVSEIINHNGQEKLRTLKLHNLQAMKMISSGFGHG